MDGARQRLAVYLGLSEDPDSPIHRSEAERPGVGKRLLEAAPFLALVAIITSLLRLVWHLIFGGDTSAVRVVEGALVFFALALVLVPICDAIARWWHESGDDPAP